MKLWMNILFNIMCFFLLAWVIYHLAICVPPIPGEEGYLAFVLTSGGIAVIIAGVAVFPAFLIDLYEKSGQSHRRKKQEEEENH